MGRFLGGRDFRFAREASAARSPTLQRGVRGIIDSPVDTAGVGRRLVTGTFRHEAANVIEVQVGSESQPFGCTDNHPFWSVDREQFVEAGQLRIGENLQAGNGTLVQVTRITPRRGPPVDVFNFEVDVDHVYHAGTTGVLVHNDCVYVERLSNGVVSYVGRSNDFGRRAAEWRNAGRNMDELIGNITPRQARALEQVLIDKFGRIMDRSGNELGGQLTNTINGIAPGNLRNYLEEIDWAQNLLQNLGV